MNYDDFVELLRQRMPVGLVLDSPGGGTSTVMSCSDVRIAYRRGQSIYQIDLCHLHDAYQHFAGGDVTTNALTDYLPQVFEQRHGGHNCHRTFFLLVLHGMGIVGDIWGG